MTRVWWLLRSDTGRNGAGENENLSLGADVLHKKLNLAISRGFADDGQEMDKSEKRTCRAC